MTYQNEIVSFFILLKSLRIQRSFNTSEKGNKKPLPLDNIYLALCNHGDFN